MSESKAVTATLSMMADHQVDDFTYQLQNSDALQQSALLRALRDRRNFLEDSAAFQAGNVVAEIALLNARIALVYMYLAEKRGEPVVPASDMSRFLDFDPLENPAWADNPSLVFQSESQGGRIPSPLAPQPGPQGI